VRFDLRCRRLVRRLRLLVAAVPNYMINKRRSYGILRTKVVDVLFELDVSFVVEVLFALKKEPSKFGKQFYILIVCRN